MGMDMQDYTLADAYTVSARDYTTAGDASAAIKRKLKQLGVDSAILRRIAVASYEAELNMIIHSLGGTLLLTVTPSEIRLVSTDVGPGIPDIEQALQEGFSTAGEEARNMGFGAGMGLPNMKRNADVFSIHSEAGKGTEIKMLFRL
jgi:serine/threonine-protein kinase RsbT